MKPAALILVFYSVPVFAGTAAPANVANNADWLLSWTESEDALNTPAVKDYLQKRAQEFYGNVPALFLQTPQTEGIIGESAPLEKRYADRHTFTGVSATAGVNGTADLDAFYGVEEEHVNTIAFLHGSRGKSGEGAYVNDTWGASGEVAFPDTSGTVLGFSGDYVLDRDNLAGIWEQARPQNAPDNRAEGGEAKAFFRSNLWGKAKFATRVGVAYTEGTFGDQVVSDNALDADLRYGFFWLGEKLARGDISLYQENYRLDRGQQGYLYGRFGLETDVPIEDRLYLSAGVTAGVFRRDEPEYYFYPISRLNLRIGSGWGCFLDYRPALNLPPFRELYVTRGYCAPAAYRPISDKYFSLRAGVAFYYRDAVRLTAAAYEYRYRQTFALRDVSFGRAEYFDPGRATVRGAEISYRFHYRSVTHFGGVDYAFPRLTVPGTAHFPYYPTVRADMGLECGFPGGHAGTANIAVIGRRYAAPDAAAPLPSAILPGASFTLALRPEIDLLLTAANITDVVYYVPGSVQGPRRNYSAGLNFSF